MSVRRLRRRPPPTPRPSVVVVKPSPPTIVFHRQKPLWIPVLCYHDFSRKRKRNRYTITPEEFERQILRLLKRGFTFIPLSLAVDYIKRRNTKLLPAKPVVVAIDDGFRSAYTVAYPILKNYKIPATLFIYTKYIGSSPNALTWEQLRELERAGFTIESHSVTHFREHWRWRRLPKAQRLQKIREELLLSKQILERQLNKRVRFFAAPGVWWSNEVGSLAKQTGYEAAFTNGYVPNHARMNPYHLSRYTVLKGDDLSDLFRMLRENPPPPPPRPPIASPPKRLPRTKAEDRAGEA